LGLPAYFAEREELVADVLRQAKADLRIIFDPFAAVPSGRAADLSRRATAFDASRHAF
jgi:hypothetical protein